MLYSCKSDMNKYELEKMVPYFWKKFYIVFIIHSIVVNVLLSTLVLIFVQNYVDTILFFIIFLFFSLIYYKIKLSDAVIKSIESYRKKNKMDIEVEIKFYDSYLVQENKNKKLKVDYAKFSHGIETNTNFYLQYIEKRRTKIIIINKDNCELELIQFIRTKINNMESNLGGDIRFSSNKKLKNSKLTKKIMSLLFLLSILSIFGGLYTFATYNEVNKINGPNFVKSAWLFWLWLPIPITSIAIGYRYKKRGLDCSKNIISGFIISILLIGLGCFSLLPYSFNEVDSNYEIIDNYRQIMGVSIPDTGQLRTTTMKSFNLKNISNLEITTVNYSSEDTNMLANEIKNNNNWVLSTELSSEFKKLLPSTFIVNSNIYYLFYNKNLNEYNTIPLASGTYNICSMKYDISKKTLIIYSFDYKNN